MKEREEREREEREKETATERESACEVSPLEIDTVRNSGSRVQVVYDICHCLLKNK